MELELLRTYLPQGTNGVLRVNGIFCCYTIELPWQNNKPNASCIPEDSYYLDKRYSNRFKAHLQVMDVPGRKLILIHPANDALTELKGCIAPVSALTGPGRGTASKEALKNLRTLVYAALDKDDFVRLTIKAIQLPNPIT
ncbi:DUF5675 family protein [Filimonas effusa]|uniref:DUF5675 domain-containing protein n=1 Tax=Filimonas effusa TaxID=2508721 RepID=A0A4Q1DCY0_9BACT|nr:DUF5675 family protein [Filimonas effusa]RXK87332.1 hypothetical protein ESB13_11300 [Filimonas effusa]